MRDPTMLRLFLPLFLGFWLLACGGTGDEEPMLDDDDDVTDGDTDDDDDVTDDDDDVTDGDTDDDDDVTDGDTDDDDDVTDGDEPNPWPPASGSGVGYGGQQHMQSGSYSLWFGPASPTMTPPLRGEHYTLIPIN